MPISTLKGKFIDAKLWIPVEEVEYEALEQIRNLCSVPGVTNVSIMGDVHAGKGATIGSVIVTENIVIPSVVGLDIGCGMNALRTRLTKDQLTTETLIKLRDGILARIPVGFNQHETMPSFAKGMGYMWEDFSLLIPQVKDLLGRAQSQIGTLGGGNHFIEISYDQNGTVWAVLHSGSRYIGNKIADAHIRLAKTLEHNVGYDKDLSTFLKDTLEFKQYMHDLKWAQEYAYCNRMCMVQIIEQYLEQELGKELVDLSIQCHHNFAQYETHFGKEVIVTRKGAISAKKDQWGIIPGSMGSKSYIVQGLGCEDSFNSAPHGAGRRMSRSKAKKTYTFEDLRLLWMAL
jgi:tRNA-splicing ligase RtcB (3'-phosphate/5'-hydroxy nucleic acid ligase)